MKKLMFAFACAASIVAMADGNSTGFEIVAGTTNLGNRDDGGGTDGPMYFSYEKASGSVDGSIVKAYGSGENLPVFDYTKLLPAVFVGDTSNTSYLELSTEGGTLWRNFTTVGARGEDGENTLGNPVPLSDYAQNNQNVYVDTLVQFTPTEDGTTPAVSGADQMAIWLNVDSTDPEAPVTNLCVFAAQLDGSFTWTTNTYTITNAQVVPGKWYRLTVKAFADITLGSCYPGFKVYLDGNLLQSDSPSFDASAASGFQDFLVSDVSLQDLANGSVFGSLWLLPENTEGTPDNPTFTAVGFKGSGALDDLVLSTDVPNFVGTVSSLDFTLTWGENVSAVTYTIDGGEPVTAVSGQKVDCPAGATIAIASATPASDWYAIDVASTASFKVEQANTTREITASEITSPIDDVLTPAVKTWATSNGKNLTPAQIAACEFAKDAYLMNTDLSAAPGLQITAIEEVEDGWQITVKGTQGANPVTLQGINGTLKVKAAAELAGLEEATATEFDFTLNQDGTATITVTGNNKNFMKATVE